MDDGFSIRKCYQDPETLVQLLRSRGMDIGDVAKARSLLSRVGYFRLSPYWHPFRLNDSVNPEVRGFALGCKLQHAVDLYVFDKRLRLLFLDAIERVEIAVRSRIADALGQRDRMAHLNPRELHGKFITPGDDGSPSEYEGWLERFEKAKKNLSSPFVRHYLDQHGGDMPIWVAVEIWDFGLLTKFFGGMKEADKRLIASTFGIPEPRMMESWMKCLNIVRNVAAHHERLWNRDFPIKAVVPKSTNVPAWNAYFQAGPPPPGRVYTLVCILIHFLRGICPNSSWPHRLRQLLDEFPLETGLGLKSMGFPDNWESHGFLPVVDRSPSVWHSDKAI